jgi:hypothetical protein
VKNRRKTIGIEEKLRVMTPCKNGEQIAEICCNVPLAPGIIHKIHDNADRIKESAQSGTEVFCISRLPQSYPYQKLCVSVSYIFIALEINKLSKNICILYRNVYILYKQYIHNLQVHMSTNDTVIHYTGSGYQPPNPQEIHRFKWEFCIRFA